LVSLGEPYIYQNLGYFTRMWDFTWKCFWWLLFYYF